ncbi:MAG: DUF177 domain-containing protein [candidate division WOR-3 bacterium]|nr:DUF177 domain-containing protein [candidate division WOR-3 bacterium]
MKIKKAKITLIRKTLGISANFVIQFSVDLICARCLVSFTKEFDESLYLEYVAGRDPLLSSERVELKSGDIDKVYYTGNDIDIGLGIRETIVLAIPSAPLCNKECRGLCLVCGKNLNKEKCDCKISKIGLFTPRLKND